MLKQIKKPQCIADLLGTKYISGLIDMYMSCIINLLHAIALHISNNY